MRERECAETGLLVRETEVGREKEKESAMGGEEEEESLIYGDGKQEHTEKYVELTCFLFFGNLKMNPAIQNLVVSLVAMQRRLSLVFFFTK